MNDARLGIVLLPLPEGREVALSLTFERLDAVGPVGIGELLTRVSKGKAGSAQARAELLEAFSDGAISVADFRANPSAYPVIATTKAIWQAWSIAQYGPDGRSGDEATANPQKRRPTLLDRLFRRR